MNTPLKLVGSSTETSEGVVPVLMEVREFTDKNTGNVLYLTASMSEIKKADIVGYTQIPNKGNPSYPPSAFTFKLADILKNVNAEDGHLEHPAETSGSFNSN